MVADIVPEGIADIRRALGVGQGGEAYLGASRSVVVADSADTTVPTMPGP